MEHVGSVIRWVRNCAGDRGLTMRSGVQPVLMESMRTDEGSADERVVSAKEGLLNSQSRLISAQKHRESDFKAETLN